MELMEVSDSERDINILGNELSEVEEDVEVNAYGSPIRASRGAQNTGHGHQPTAVGPSTSNNRSSGKK